MEYDVSKYPKGVRPVSSIDNFNPSKYLEPLHELHDTNMKVGDVMKKEVCLYRHMLIYWVTADTEMTEYFRQCRERRDLGLPKRIPKISSRFKKQLTKLGPRFNWTCVYCQKPGTEELGPDGRIWQIDHIYARARGGDDKSDNLILACATCNLLKNADLASEILASVKGRAE